MKKDNFVGMKAVAYARYSSNMQRIESIQAQLSAIQRFAENEGIEIIREYCDEAISGQTDVRPQFQMMVQDAREHNFQLVIVHKLDRFGRDVLDTFDYISKLADQNVKVVSAIENFDDSPEGALFQTISIALNAYYSHNLGREVLKGQMENAKAGKTTGGLPPLGFRVNPDTFMYEINEDEAQCIIKIFGLFLEGYGYKRIIETLNQDGYKTRAGKPFTSNSLYAILRNEKYRGCVVFNKVAKRGRHKKRNNHSYKPDNEILRIENGCPRIVSDEDFTATQLKMNARQQPTGHARYKETYLLTSKIFCEHCQAAYVGSRRMRTDGTYWPYYTCSRRSNSKGTRCKGKEIGRNYLESRILEYISEYVFQDENVTVLKKAYDQFLADNKENNVALSEKKKQRKRLSEKIDRVIELLLDIKSNMLRDKLKDMELEVERLDNDIYTLSKVNTRVTVDKDEIRRTFAQIRKMLMDKNEDTTRRLINMYVDRIEVGDKAIQIQFNYLPTLMIPRLIGHQEKYNKQDEAPLSEIAGGASANRDQFGAGGRTRTDTVSLPTDFESVTSANSITPAQRNILA